MGRHSARATRALQKLSESDPAFAALSLWMDHEDSDAREQSAWSERGKVLYGAPFEAHSLDEQIGLAGHHILHVALRHGPRGRALRHRFGGSFDEDLFNIAADAIINESLFVSGYIVPRPAVTLSELLSASLGETLSPEEALTTYDVETLYAHLSGRGAAEGKGGADGESSARGAARAFAQAQGFEPDLDLDEEGSDPGHPDDENAWRQRLMRAFEGGTHYGQGLGTIGARLADIPKSGVRWEGHLQGLLTKALLPGERLSYRRPMRRWIASEAAARSRNAPVPAFEPAPERHRAAARIAICFDASSSIDDARLSLFAAQVVAIAQRTAAELHLLVFDEEVRDQQQLTPDAVAPQLRRLRLPREGGTDFRPVLDAAHALDPSVIVVQTDLDGPFGKAPRNIPVIWAVADGANRGAPFGTVISLDH